MNIAVFGLVACVFGAGNEGPADTGSIWIQFKGSESAKKYGIDHPIVQGSNALCYMFSMLGNAEMKEKDSIEIRYNEYTFDIIAGLLKEKPTAESDNIPISFEQLLHVFELINYLDFNKDTEKHINSRLFQKTLDGKNAENVFAATRNNEMSTASMDKMHTPLAYFLCLKAYAEAHGLHMRIDTIFSAVTICAYANWAHISKHDNLLSISSVSILAEIYSWIDRNAMNANSEYWKSSEHVVSTILKICKEAGIKGLDVSSGMLHSNDFELLGKMDNLKHLDISCTNISNDGLKEILKVTSLEKLVMFGCDIKKEYEFDGIDNMQTLKYLDISFNRLSNDGLKKIFELASLEELKIFSCSIQNEYKFDGISNMKALKHLDISVNMLSNDSLKKIFELASLEELKMFGCGIQNEYKFDEIDNMQSLKHLDLSFNRLSDDSMKNIFELASLEKLVMFDSGIEKEYKLDEIAKMKSLKHLDLSFNRLTNDSMKNIFELENLEELIMKKCGITKDDKLDEFDKMTSLKHLELNDNMLSKASIEKIFKLTNLEKLVMMDCGIDENYSLLGLINLVKLVHLEIGRNSLSSAQKVFIRSLNIGTVF